MLYVYLEHYGLVGEQRAGAERLGHDFMSGHGLTNRSGRPGPAYSLLIILTVYSLTLRILQNLSAVPPKVFTISAALG